MATLDIACAFLHAVVEDGDEVDVEVLSETEAGHDEIDGTQERIVRRKNIAPMLRQYNKLRRVWESVDVERRAAVPSICRLPDDMDLTAHVEDISLSGQYVLILVPVRKLQQELQISGAI